MRERVQELCRQLAPVLGTKIDGLWTAYLAESDPAGRADIEQVLELLAAKHLGHDYQPDRSPFPPPPEQFALSGDVPIGTVMYGGRSFFPARLRSRRLAEHALICGRSGSGKTNLLFVLLDGLMRRGIKAIMLDWKRSYRDLLQLHPNVRVLTVGRNIAPIRFNPLIPPPGCEPQVWLKLITEVISGSYTGGDGVVSLLVAGLDRLYTECGATTGTATYWPTIGDLLSWLRSTKLRGRAALWQASAERILLALTYGETGRVFNTPDNADVLGLLDESVVLEMDGLSSASDRVMFSEALALYLYRYRLAQGPRADLSHVLVVEEAHNLLLASPLGTRESVLETSIRMIRQYGIGLIFVDQSASLLSKVAFANTYATIALSQKLRSDVQTMTNAMNLTDGQRDALSTLSIGTAIVRLADEHPEPFLIHVPRCPIIDGKTSDEDIRARMHTDSADTSARITLRPTPPAIPPIPSADRIQHDQSHPPSPHDSWESSLDPSPATDKTESVVTDSLSRDAIRFLADVEASPLSTTVSRYARLHLSRRRGNAIRADLLHGRLIDAVPIATRAGQVVLLAMTDLGRRVCDAHGIVVGLAPRASVEHTYWCRRVAEEFAQRGYDAHPEWRLPDGGAVDVVAERQGERVAVEVETGRSDITANLEKVAEAGFDRVVLVATSPSAVEACQKALERQHAGPESQLLTWLDFS